MVQIIQAANKRRSFGSEFGSQFGAGLGEGISKELESQRLQGNLKKENEAAKRLGIDLSGIQDPKIRQEIIAQKLQGTRENEKYQNELKENESLLSDLEKRRELEPGSLKSYRKDPKLAEQVTRPTKEGKTPVSEKPVPVETSKKMKKIVADNPKSTADDLLLKMDEEGIPRTFSNPFTENRRRSEEQMTKSSEDRKRALRQETLPFRTDLANKATVAEKSIQNKEGLLDLIEKGDITDPTLATLAEQFPLNLAKRMLSNDTVVYKGGLVEEYGDLKNIFSGATRVKEIDILEAKIADVYLNDEQKKAILKSRIKAEKAHIIRANAAAQLEDRDDLGILQFEKEVERIAKPQLDALFNQILDEQKYIIQNAENKKKIALDPKDPDDLQIMQQIKKEAGGDKQKAKELAKKKGYIVIGSS